tara:strand:- start:27434 stop:27955 length:522 start_codon:yes stop_codon:yes gene_type:complete
MNFNLDLFVTPVIALSLVLWGYIYFSKLVKNRNRFHKTLWAIALLAFGLNWIWEVAQGPLYEGFVFDLEHISFCGLASIADMFMVILLWFGFALIYKDIYWIGQMKGRRVFWLILAGGIGAILAEMRHTAAGNWSYAQDMPLIPWVEVGLSPVLQFSFLPLIIFFFTKRIVNR